MTMHQHIHYVDPKHIHYVDPILQDQLVELKHQLTELADHIQPFLTPHPHPHTHTAQLLALKLRTLVDSCQTDRRETST